MKKWFIGIILFTACLLLLVSCSGAGTSSAKNYNKVIELLHDAPRSQYSIFKDKPYDGYDFKIAAGLAAIEKDEYPKDVNHLNDLMVDQGFYEEYIEKYGMYDLLDHFNDCIAYDGSLTNYNPNDYTPEYVAEIKKRDKEVHEALYNLPAYKGLATVVFDGGYIQENDNSEGYYSDQENTHEEKEVTGEFNDASNDNEIYEESATQEESVSYYGDWMVEHNSGEDYDEGKYGWSEGQFYDESPSWESYSYFAISYKGQECATISADTLDDIYIEFKKIDDRPDESFYIAYNDTYKTERINWVEVLFDEQENLSENNEEEQTDNAEDNNEGIMADAYEAAKKLKKSGDYEAAIKAFEELDGYKDSDKQIKKMIHSTKWLSICPVGDTVFFGHYEQDGKKSNGKEEIEWIVLDRKDDKIFVISKKALDVKKYNNSLKKVTWETCSLRKWLNDTFLIKAFTNNEISKIPTVKVKAERYSTNNKWKVKPGNDTEDKIFLLSVNEAYKYFTSDEDRKCVGTKSVINRSYAWDGGTVLWWLRSPGMEPTQAAEVLWDGEMAESGSEVNSEDYGETVRPAMWINTK